MRIRRFLLLIILGCFVGAAPAFSQEDLDETYIAPDDSFQFSYPGDWEVDDESFEDIGFVSLSGEVGRDTVFITFMGPEFVDVLAPDAGDVEEAAEKTGDQVSETAAKTAAEIDDKRLGGKVGPGGQVVYISDDGKYYYISEDGKKVFVTETELRDK